MASPGETLAEHGLTVFGRLRRFPAFIRRNLLLIIFGAILVMQVLIWLRLDLIMRTIPYGQYEGPLCDEGNPCHVVIDKPRYP